MSKSIFIKRALLSVSDKTNIVALATVLKRYNCEIISTGGTQKILQQAGIETVDISTITGNPEAFGGRVKTLSFKIAGAVLFDRTVHEAEAKDLDIVPIDLVVCNLYPFQEVAQKGGALEELIEQIDIGGATMIRSAAKNFESVGVLTSPKDYTACIRALEINAGALPYQLRKEWMVKAFRYTASYDTVITKTMGEDQQKKQIDLSFVNGQDLRYGENSHQSAQWYAAQEGIPSLADMKVLHGKSLSFNNLLDINGALESIKNCQESACAVVKHSNPCGMTEGVNQLELLELAWAGDPISAFGSIISFNRKLELETVQFLDLKHDNRAKRKFVEVIVAPSFEPEALHYLKEHKNLRIIQFDVANLKYQQKDIRFLNGILLVQDTDDQLYEKLEIVTPTEPGKIARAQPLITFGQKVIRAIKSNAIAIVRQTSSGTFQLLGMGAGQPNRLIATQLAIQKSKQNLHKEYKGVSVEDYQKEVLGEAWLISDAFFPFADTIELAAAAGIRNIVQPGGSIRDKEVIKVCEVLGVTMVMTGLRHFKH